MKTKYDFCYTGVGNETIHIFCHYACHGNILRHRRCRGDILRHRGFYGKMLIAAVYKSPPFSIIIHQRYTVATSRNRIIISISKPSPPLVAEYVKLYVKDPCTNTRNSGNKVRVQR